MRKRKTRRAVVTTRKSPFASDTLLPNPKFVTDLPLKTRKTTNKYKELLTPLLKRKNAWALIARFDKIGTAHARANNLRTRKVLLPGNGNFEFSSRQASEGGGAELYARYLG